MGISAGGLELSSTVIGTLLMHAGWYSSVVLFAFGVLCGLAAYVLREFFKQGAGIFTKHALFVLALCTSAKN